VLRLDGVGHDGGLDAPPTGYGCELLIDAALAAVRHVSVLSPLPTTPMIGVGGR
jgi:hypothetical protein